MKTSGRNWNDLHYSTSYHSLVPDNIEQIKNYGMKENFKGLGSVYNDYRLVYYTQIVEHYIIKKSDESLLLLFLQRGVLISSILIIIAIIIFFCVPNFRRTLSLYGKKWINTEGDKALVFKHSWLFRCKLTEIYPKNQHKYLIVFSKNRTLYKISGEEGNEHIFKLLKISDKELIIHDIITNKSTTFKSI